MDFAILHKVDGELAKSEVAALKFLCMNYIGRKQLEQVKDAKDLFLRLQEQSLLENELFLIDLLYTIGRSDLVSTMGYNKNDVIRLLQSQSSGVSAYRKMLYNLYEDVTDEKLHDIKFLLHKLPKAKLTSATFLDVLTEMEKMEMLGEDNLDDLVDVLSKCSKDLAYRVQKFKKTRRADNVNRISRLNLQDNTGLSVPTEEQTISPSVPTEEQSISPSVPTEEQSISQSVSTEEQSISLPNMSVPETNPVVPERPQSIPWNESLVDSDSQGSEMVSTINAEECYLMTRRPLGLCLIINNFDFSSCKLGNRRGTDVDKDTLTEVFTSMHFLVEVRRDLSSSEMQKTVRIFSEKDHSNMDAFVCCILSHGEKGTVLGTDGKPVLIRDLTQPFAQCLTLTGKPKLFFVQACQGSYLQQGVLSHDGTEDYEADAHFTRIPIQADFLIGMATVESYKSFRHTTDGSIYIQELCKQLKIGCPKKEDILSILTKVNRNVSAQDLNNHKQMPEPRYTLTKKLVLPMN